MKKDAVTPEDDGRFGAEVRRQRIQAGLSQAQLAGMIPLSQTAVSDIELGKTAAKRDQAERIDQVLDADGHLVAMWKSHYDGFRPPEWYKKVPEMERRATEIQDYNPLVVPGILQTKDYARATVRAVNHVATAQEIQAVVDGRSKRQEVLHGKHPPFLSAVVDQAVLYRRLGDPEIMRAQLDYLRKASTWEHVEILVIPGSTWNQPGLDGMFRLLKVPEAGTVLYQEAGATGAVVIDPKVVEKYVTLLSRLRGVALPPDQSRDLLESAQGEFE